MKFKIRLLTILLAICWSSAYKILAAFPLPSKSHSILGDAHVKHLLAAGHEITYITPFPYPEHPRLRQIQVGTENYPAEVDIKKMLEKKVDLNDSKAVMTMLLRMARHTLENDDVQRLINDPREEFDVVIVQWLFTQIYCGFAAVFDCPYIWSSSLDTHPILLSLIDEPSNPAYTTGTLSKNLAPFTFHQRVQELWYLLKYLAIMTFYQSHNENTEYKRLFGAAVYKRGRTLPPYEELQYNGSLILGNSYPILGQPLPLPQNYKAVGGFHIDLQVAPLPQDLNSFINSSNNGVIYFSLGSNLKSKDLPKEIVRNLLVMFGNLKYSVVWKYEDRLDNVPENLRIVKWVPQTSILAHSNCILFVTHGGLLSTTEALHFAKPIVGIPVYADQFINVKRAVLNGYAKQVDFGYELANDVRLAIEVVLGDPRYTVKAQEMSRVYHDRLVPPAAELVHWVQLVARTRGARHLRSPALMVPWYQKMYLDLLLQAVLVIYGVKLIVCRLFS